MCWLTSPVVVSFMALPLEVGRKALRPPSPAASSTTAVGTSEEEGLHACPLPHNFEVAFYLVSRDFGGGRIGTFSLPPHNAGVYFGGEGTGPSPHNVDVLLGRGGTGLPPRTIGVHLMPLTVENDELIYVPRPKRAVTVEGNRAVSLRLCRLPPGQSGGSYCPT